MFIAMGYVIGFDRAVEIVSGSGQIPPPETAHAEDIPARCPGDRIMPLIVEEVPGEFLAGVEAAALQPGEAETTEDRRIHASVKLAAKREGSLVELMRALGAVTLKGNKGGSEGDPDVEFERIAVWCRRLVGEQRKRSSKQGDRFIEGRHRYRSGDSHAVGLNGLLDHAGLVVVCGEIINELGLIDPSSRDHQTDREGPTNHGRYLGESPSAVSELAQSGAQRRPHRRCEHRLTSIRRDRGSKRFDSEEWCLRRVGRVAWWSLPGHVPRRRRVQQGDAAVGSPPSAPYRR